LKDRAVQAATKVLETVLRPFGSVGAQVLAMLRSAGNAFGTIVTNPGGFLSNLCTAVQAGFRQFASRIGTHLQNGLVAWLTGALGSTVSVPSKLDARRVVSLVLQVLNINYGRFRGLLAKRLGDAKVKRLESGFALMQRIASNGFVAAIQQMMQSAQQLQQLQQTVVEGIRNWVIETVVKQAVLKVVATFTGLGAIANVIQAIYNARSFFIEQASQITWEIKVHLTEQVQLEMEATNLVDTLARDRTSSGDLATLFPSKCVLIADFYDSESLATAKNILPMVRLLRKNEAHIDILRSQAPELSEYRLVRLRREYLEQEILYERIPEDLSIRQRAELPLQLI
jgi:hypothetical protein